MYVGSSNDSLSNQACKYQKCALLIDLKDQKIIIHYVFVPLSFFSAVFKTQPTIRCRFEFFFYNFKKGKDYKITTS